MQGAKMKTAAFPSIRVEPDLRRAAEENLIEGETLSSFVEDSIRSNIERRQVQAEFIARGLASRDSARKTGNYVAAAAVIKKLERRLALAKTGGTLKAGRKARSES
jgi:predicted transcriptional regulator